MNPESGVKIIPCRGTDVMVASTKRLVKQTNILVVLKRRKGESVFWPESWQRNGPYGTLRVPKKLAASGPH